MNTLPKYKDASLPIAERVEDLISRMTPAEKAAQTDMMSGSDLCTKPSPLHNCSVEPDTDYRFDEMIAICGDNGVGFIHDNYSTPQAQNKLQKYFIEHSRLAALHKISAHHT